jgi:type IV secretory pathway protease TraF
MNAAVLLARNAIAAATSLGCANRRMGTLLKYRASPSLPCGLFERNSSVSVGPGAMAFAVIPSAARTAYFGHELATNFLPRFGAFRVL